MKPSSSLPLHLLHYIVWTVIIFAVASCRTNEAPTSYDIQKTAITDNAMVVSAHPLATQVGVDILKKGGNAVDAAIAVQLALAVVYPNAGNIGGGGFMIFRDSAGNAKALDYREKAPMSASRDMYLDSLGKVTQKSVEGHLAVGVPGTVAGLFAAHQYANLDFKLLIQPAINLAENGFVLTAQQAQVLNDKREGIIKNNPNNPTAKVFWQPNDGWSAGGRIIQPALANTLRRVRDIGQAGFYEGETAELIVQEMQKGGGIITKEDLKNYQAKWRVPVSFDYDDYKIFSMPPPSSGGVALAQLLGMVEPFPLDEYGFHSVAAVHAMVEAERRAYADRAKHMGDADFFYVPANALINEDYLKTRMKDFDADVASLSADISAGNALPFRESKETTHLSVVDAAGNAVAVTTTLNTNFGSKVVVEGAGFFLNNEMDDFSAKPGTPNFYGLVGGEANAIMPQKRMLSSMTPTIIEKDGELFMVVGTPGGSTIITSVFQVFLNVAEFDMSMSEAVAAKRFHHQWLPNKVNFEAGAFPIDTLKALEAMGHTLEMVSPIGRVEAILVTENGQLEGAADPRGDDHAAGF